MKTDSRAALQRWFLVAACGIAVTLSLVACGKKGDPQPPLRIIPNRTTDLAVVQQGSVLELRMSYPKTTTSGHVMPGLDKVELWELVQPLADPNKIPTVDPRVFAGSAQLRVTLSGAELASATQGDQIVSRLQLPGTHEEPPQLHVFAVRTLATGGEFSAYSNLVPLVPSEAPTPPTHLGLTPRAGGVVVQWEGGGTGVVGYNVYRRLAIARSYGTPLGFVAAKDESSYFDRTARYGNRYIYTVTAVASQTPLRESSFAEEREIDYSDVFPPAPPVGLVPLPQEGGMRLVWKASPDADTVGYNVYRRDPGAAFRRLNASPVTELKFLDSGLTSGLTFTYKVTAVDSAGNEGAPTPEVQATPR